MRDYEPLDLSSVYNAGQEVFQSRPAPPSRPLNTEFYGPDRTALVGHQMFHGLPFHIGGEEGKPCFLAFGREPQLHTGPVTIPVGQMARRVIFAHVLLESRLYEGDPPGSLV